MKFLINKCGELNGNIRVSGAKNSALPILAASILSNGKCVLNDIPALSDIQAMCDLLSHMGCSIDIFENQITSCSKNITKFEAPYDLVSSFRGSFLVAGPLLAKYGYAKISLPGGCAIGTRPVDLHIKGLISMGAKIEQGNGYIEAHAKKLKGTKIYLDFPSVGATENLIMAATLAKGQTILENAATEPEIVDLANFLTSMGASIHGAGTDTIKISGVDELKGTIHTIIPDRIEAGTYMTAACAIGGKLVIENVIPSHLKPLSAKLREVGVDIKEKDTSIIVSTKGQLKPSDIKTMPFPGFPTDMQSQFMSLMSTVPGTSVVVETVFENRFMHSGELRRMGANIKVEGRTAVIEGVNNLSGAHVKATDLRAGAGLVIAGLCAKGETVIDDIENIDRGYEHIEDKLRGVGANIERIT